ncbi:MAG: tryptophan 2,3-dioxygenase family protein, partial [Providencia rustigianii]
EILVQWDDMISTWRVRHYKIAVRTLGHGSIGTKGDNLDKLSEKLNIKYFPRLWELRARLTEISTN